MTARPRQRRRLILFLALGALVVLGALAIAGYRSAPRLVTRSALRRARELAAATAGIPLPPPRKLFELRLFKDAPAFEKALERAVEALAADYGVLFRAGYFDPELVIDEVPREGFTPEALPLAILCGAYSVAFKDAWNAGGETAIREAARWARAVGRSARAKECLINLLIRDLEILPGSFEPAGLPKLMLMTALTCRDLDDYGWGKDRQPELDESLQRVLGQLTADDWRPVLEHSRHEREGVRAG